MSKQSELTRGALISFVNELDEKIIDVQPDGFNNTIRWHVGHLLVSAEGLMFGYPEHSNHIPESYNAMFKTGTKPSDWGNAEVPTLSALIESLEKQTVRLNELSEEFLAGKLPFQFPVGNPQTYGEMFEFVMFHEAYHLGQMKAMNVITKR
jgi:hypothetical protein